MPWKPLYMRIAASQVDSRIWPKWSCSDIRKGHAPCGLHRFGCLARGHVQSMLEREALLLSDENTGELGGGYPVELHGNAVM